MGSVGNSVPRCPTQWQLQRRLAQADTALRGAPPQPARLYVVAIRSTIPAISVARSGAISLAERLCPTSCEYGPSVQYPAPVRGIDPLRAAVRQRPALSQLRRRLEPGRRRMADRTHHQFAERRGHQHIIVAFGRHQLHLERYPSELRCRAWIRCARAPVRTGGSIRRPSSIRPLPRSKTVRATICAGRGWNEDISVFKFFRITGEEEPRIPDGDVQRAQSRPAECRRRTQLEQRFEHRAQPQFRQDHLDAGPDAAGPVGFEAELLMCSYCAFTSSSSRRFFARPSSVLDAGFSPLLPPSAAPAGASATTSKRLDWSQDGPPESWKDLML